MKEYLGTLPPGQPNTFLPWAPAPGLLQTGDLCPAAGPATTSGRHSARPAVGHLENGSLWSCQPEGEREAGPRSPREGFCPLQTVPP